jgi:DNA-binding CsgD family transcriptional regulator
MPRRRHGEIEESPERLEQLALFYKGQEEEFRIRMLQLLQQDDTRTMAQAATLIPCSERSVRRWWQTYRDGGLTALLNNDLRAVDAMASVSMARSARSTTASTGMVPSHIVSFLNALPVMGNIVQWGNAFRDALRTFLGDVDHITISIDVDSKGDGVRGTNQIAFITQNVEADTSQGMARSTVVHRGSTAHGEMTVRAMSAGGFLVSLYHPPHILDYQTASGLYIGTIILWRETTQRRISDRTRETMRQLEPFLVFLLSDCAARHRQNNPDLEIFTRLIDVVGSGLRPRQKDVLLQYMLGKTNPEIATALGITVAAVRKHISHIYNVTGASNLNELIARSMAPLREKGRDHRRRSASRANG